MKLKPLLAFLLFAVMPFAAGAASGITGVWVAGAYGDLDVSPWVLALKAEGAKLSGTVMQGGGPTEKEIAEIDAGAKLSGAELRASGWSAEFVKYDTAEIYDGEVNRNTITFKVQSPDHDRTIIFTGIVNGDEIAFTRKVVVKPGGSAGEKGIFGASGALQFKAQREAPPPEPAQNLAGVPPSLLAALQKDFSQAGKLEDRSCAAQPLTERLYARRFDLDRSQEGWLMEGLPPCLSGGDNGEKFLYISVGASWRKIPEGLGQTLAVCAQAVPPCPIKKGSQTSPAGTQGWPDVALWVSPTATANAQLVYRFNGNVYKPIACNHVYYENPNTRSKPRYSRCERRWEAQKTAEIPSSLLAMLKDEVKSFGSECLPLEDHHAISRFDLNRPLEAWLVEGIDGCLRGNDNGEISLYIRADKGWRLIFSDVAQSLEVCGDTSPNRVNITCTVPRASKPASRDTRGWPDLAAFHHGSATEGDQVVYRFDGNVYEAVGCIHMIWNNSTDNVHGPCFGNWQTFPRERADIPSDLIPTLQKDLNNYDYFKGGCLGPQLKQHVNGSWLDLNHSQRALLVECAPNEDAISRTMFLLYIRRGNSWHKILTAFDDEFGGGLRRSGSALPGRNRVHAHVRQYARLARSLGLGGWLHQASGVSVRWERLPGGVCTDVQYAKGWSFYSPPRFRPCPSGWKAAEQRSE